MAVPYTFSTATGSLPLSQLDSNFSTAITIGNTAVVLGDTITTINNLTLGNVAITSVSAAFPNGYLANSNVIVGTTTLTLGSTVTSINGLSLSNVTISSGNVTISNVTTTNVTATTANVTTANVGTLVVIGDATVGGNTTVTGNITAAKNLTFTGTGNRITGDFSNATQTNRVSFQSSTTNGNTSIAAIPNGTATSTNWVAFSTADPTNSSFIRIRADGTAALTYLESGASGSGTNLPLTFNTNGSERMRLDTSGNLGLGVTPSAWAAGYSVIQFGASTRASAIFTNGINDLWQVSNIYYNGSTWIYSKTGTATGYEQLDGAHRWYAVGSGTAGNNATLTQAMTLDASGNLLVGSTLSYAVNGGAAAKQFVASSGSNGSTLMRYNGFGTYGAILNLATSAGAALGTYSGAVNGNGLGSIFFGGDNGTNYTGTGAVIRATASETWTTSTNAAYLSFDTTTSGSVSATEKMRIDSSGNVGIGTTSPAYLLDVTGSARSYGFTSTAVGTPATPTAVGSTTGGSLAANTWYFKIVALDGLGGVTLPSSESTVVTTTGATSSIAVSWTATTGAKSYQVWYSNTTGTQANYFAATTNSLSFTTVTGNTAGTIPASNTTGSVLVGTTTNANGYKAVVLDDIAIRTATDATGATNLRFGVSSSMPQGTSIVSGTKTAGGAGYLTFGTATGGTNGERMRIDESGNVGIGTSSLGQKLTVKDATAGATSSASFANNNNGVYVRNSTSTTSYVGDSTGATNSIAFDTTNYVAILTNGSERIRFDSAGNAQFQTGAVMPYAPAPAAVSAATTLTNANIQGQIISATGTTYTITMPLGSTLDTLATWATTNISYDFYVINTASGVITMAVNTGVTSLGSLTVAIGASAHFRIRRTAASTYVLYRLS
jgi:hypothetical protein